MLERMNSLPEGIDGFEASGTLTGDDYRTVFEPFLAEARIQGRRVRLLFYVGADFEGSSAGAVWEDARLGLRYLRIFERCALVTDVGWIRKGVRFSAPFMPFPVRVFGTEEGEEALRWLQFPAGQSAVSHRLIPSLGVLVVEVHGHLEARDFDSIAMTVDPWIEAHGALTGVVIHAVRMTGWENVGAFLRHLRFVRNHHHDVKRLALVADGGIAQALPRVVDPFVDAEVRTFDEKDLQEAMDWVADAGPQRSLEV